jgi:hypothetical protein
MATTFFQTNKTIRVSHVESSLWQDVNILATRSNALAGKKLSTRPTTSARLLNT